MSATIVGKRDLELSFCHEKKKTDYSLCWERREYEDPDFSTS